MTSKKEVKLHEILHQLVSDKHYSGNRKKLCDDLGVSSSALSQYVRGRAKPSFDTLVAMALTFETSLDYLVFGKQTSPQSAVDYGPVARYMDLALSGIAAKADRRAEMVTRVARVLAEQLDRHVANYAERVTRGQVPAHAGLLTDEETMMLERFSARSIIVTMNLQYDIVKTESGEEAAGRFLTIVAQNLREGKGYRFLLPSKARDWRPVVASFVRLLKIHCGNDQQVHQNCKFRITDQPLFAGSGFYRLDLEKLRADQPHLYTQVQHSIDQDGWLGYMIPPSTELQADALMDTSHLKRAREAVDRIWNHSKAV